MANQVTQGWLLVREWTMEGMEHTYIHTMANLRPLNARGMDNGAYQTLMLTPRAYWLRFLLLLVNII